MHNVPGRLGLFAARGQRFRRLSVRDNLMAVLELRNELSKAERVAKADQLLAEFHLNHVADSLARPFQEASADGLKLPAHWPWTRRLSCSTNPLPALTQLASKTSKS